MMIKLPRFPFLNSATIEVFVGVGIDEGGKPNTDLVYDGVCHWDEVSKTKRGGDGIDISLSGIAFINGDIAPTIEKITGHAAVNSGSPRKIHSAKRIRDFSGSVHHIELELI